MSQTNIEFKIYPNDPYGVRVYTLRNGLKVYLSEDNDEPRIKTRIVVKAGATSDPADSTGLAHYVEHMMFKGTDLIGALNRDKEASIISKIKNSYEELAKAESSEDVIRINNEIDNLSSAASLEAIPGELDKLYSIMGCKNTNARTGFEETVYENDIPKVELERWISLEKERFTSPVLRLFPPELEVVYEEFNQSQDDDVSRAFDCFLSGLFPVHPYGRAGILGKGEHLKKPSMERIEEFLGKWYVPSNMAIVLTGDIDFDNTIELIDKYWGNINSGDNPVKNPVIEEDIKKPMVSTVYGPESPFVLIGYRFNGFGTKDELYLTLIDMIMSNNQAGTLDLNLVQKQKVLEAESSYEVYRDYSWFTLYGVPGANQSLKDVSRLLLEQINLLRNGNFESWYNSAVINCFEIDRINELENGNKIESFVDAFITGLSWDNYLKRLDKLKKITFEELIGFINERFKENYHIVFKKKGKPRDIFYIKKPNLTPVLLNREVESDFCTTFKDIVVPRSEPQFPDFSSLKPMKLDYNRKLYYEKNEKNDLFELLITFEFGRLDDLHMHYGAEFRDFIGAGRFTAKAFHQELFKKGLDLVVVNHDDSTTVSLSGRERDFNFGLTLMVDFFIKGSADKKSFRKFLKRISLMRKNAKNSRRMILWGALYNYVHYGKDNPFRHYLTIGQLKKAGSEGLINAIRKLCKTDFSTYYYGPGEEKGIRKIVNDFTGKFVIGEINYLRKIFTTIKSSSKRFLYVNYDMVQAEILLTGRGVKFRKELLPIVFLFNEYFGGGMDSVVFQEVRERRGLAYSAYANYALPKDQNGYFIFNFYVGTQGDKAVDALRCILGLLEFFPKVSNYFSAVKSSILKNIESESVLKKDYYFVKKNSEKYGLDCDMRQYVYKKIKELSIDDLELFFNKYIKNLIVHTLIIGSKHSIEIREIEAILNCKVERKSLKSIFGY